MDVEVAGLARNFVELAEGDGVVDAILGHVAIGGPFAADDGEQAGALDVDGVIARERGGFACAVSADFTSGRMPT